MIKRLSALLLALMLMLPMCVSAEVFNYDDRLTIVAMLGDESDFIYAVELALYEKGYLDELCVDGWFDEYTEYAVQCFQYDKGYVADGMLTKIQFYWLSRKYYNNWFDSSYVVWMTASGSRYHLGTCPSLENSLGVMPISINLAWELGYQPCKKCRPY